jgi:PPOX class probable F420-dependent enzyme
VLEDGVQELAGGRNIATRVTLMPDGRPQALPTWVDHDGEHLLLNTERERQAARNVARDPRVTVLIWDPENTFRYVEVRGRVVEVVGGDEARAHIDQLSQKYTGHDYRNPIGSERVILKVAPEHQIVRM